MRLHVRAFRSQHFIGSSLVLLLVLALPAWARGGAESPAHELAVRYSPVLVLAPQARACGSAEASRPTSVNILLGRPGVPSGIRAERS
jgi:hypothetical protein